jgi:hypothetical protein
MPRANRHFLPGHVWHINHRYPGTFVPIVPMVRRLAMSGFILNRFAPLKTFQADAGSKRSKVPVVPIAQLLRVKTMPVRNPKISKRQRLGCGNEKLEALLRQFRNPGAY